MPDAESMFLGELQICIDRYQPILEREFSVQLGEVAAEPLRIQQWLASIYTRSDEELNTCWMLKRGCPPSAMRTCLHRFEKRLLWVPALVFLALRTWLPRYYFRWRETPPAVLVSLSGWRRIDFVRIRQELDQLTVHELAHGVWDRIASVSEGEHTRRWRLWNEGFCHYIADIHFRKHYPPEAVVSDQFSAFRIRGRDLVKEVVDMQGPEALKSVPLRWMDFHATLS
jgi:hypothetical protein